MTTRRRRRRNRRRKKVEGSARASVVTKALRGAVRWVLRGGGSEEEVESIGEEALRQSRLVVRCKGRAAALLSLARPGLRPPRPSVRALAKMQWERRRRREERKAEERAAACEGGGGGGEEEIEIIRNKFERSRKNKIE